ncbi:DUF3833 domain-containing protein [Massilia sp. P8910]|uniref:DUF3833 domain-containing protein n=1 Tax=Massilia antarctica TaxID=2765360 RepID=UPI001E41DD64|nr:DUF3833 domain-containing protein [Massilia antarctica]MCE3603406.1 DUF3833 domain-containing protein [Massilia antarctica]
MKLSTIFAAGFLALSVAGCSTPTPETYAKQSPGLDITQYFSGTLDAHGMFQDRSGEVIKRFVVVMRCQWTGDTGVLDEDFVYSDGTRQKRVWTLTKTGQGSFTASAADVVGLARGTVSGNALRWQYVLALPVDGKVINMDMDDWMFLIDDKVMLNRTAMSKFGVNLGSVTLSFAKRQAPQ